MLSQRDARAAEGQPDEELITVDPATGLKLLPHWVAQPYFRPLPKVAEQVEKKNDEKAEAVVAKGTAPACPPGKQRCLVCFRRSANALGIISRTRDARCA